MGCSTTTGSTTSYISMRLIGVLLSSLVETSCIYEARKITACDEAYKAFRHITLIDGLCESCEGAMETRLLFSVAFGSTWFGRWGYTFPRGSYGVSRDTYTTAIESLESLPLTEVEEIVEKYKKICLTPLECMRDLLSFMLQMRCGARGRKRTDLNKDLWTVYDEVLMRRKIQFFGREFSSLKPHHTPSTNLYLDPFSFGFSCHTSSAA
ncbi:unnamed protein product [Prunus armeniaca]